MRSASSVSPSCDNSLGWLRRIEPIYATELLPLSVVQFCISRDRTDLVVSRIVIEYLLAERRRQHTS